jgi:hypothetical protein
MKLKKNQLKKLPESIHVNLSNPRFGSRDHDNQIKSKLKQIIDLNSQSN